MTNPPPRGAAPARAAQSLACLMPLSKRDMRMVLVVRPDGGRELVIAALGATSLNGCVIPYAAFTVARDHGWLSDADGQGLHYSLSSKGRLALRRMKSAGEGAPGQSAPTAIAMPAGEPSSASVNPAESPLGWLRKRRDKSGQPLISAVQYDAGERLRGDLWFAQMSPRVTANWSGVGGTSKSGGGLGIDIRDNVAAAQQRVRRALTAVAPLSAGLLLDVCGHLVGLEQIERDRGWPPRSGKIALQLALSELARHYGLPGTDAASAPLAQRLRHWGVDDYRPHIGRSET